MLRVQDATNINQVTQKRLIRPLYAHTQGYPYACTIDPSLRNVDGSFRAPLATDTTPTFPATRSAAAFLLNGGLVPGTVMIKGAGETMVVATGGTQQPFGLLGQFVGGSIDEIGGNNEIGVWRGLDSVYELLAPAWNDTGLAAAVAAAGAGVNVPLYAGADGRLTSTNPGGAVVVANLIERVSASLIRIDLKV